MLDRKRAEEAFNTYTAKYDQSNTLIWLKVVHTFKVAENCDRIGNSLCLKGDDADLAWLLGLLHDFGRFEQVRRYNTFSDAASVDHAELGADILFKEGFLKDYIPDGMSEDSIRILETAIRLHNKLALPEGLDERTELFCNIIRDADKADIFRVITELPLEQRIGSSKNAFAEADEASAEIMERVMEHRCVPRAMKHTRFELHISHCCMAFEVVFPESRRIIQEQGFLEKLLLGCDEDGKPMWNEREMAQLAIVRREIHNAWGG